MYDGFRRQVWRWQIHGGHYWKDSRVKKKKFFVAKVVSSWGLQNSHTTVKCLQRNTLTFVLKFEPPLLNKPSILVSGPNQAIERRRQNPDHSHTCRDVLISNGSCSHCNQLSIADVRRQHIFHWLYAPSSLRRTDLKTQLCKLLRLSLPSTLIGHEKVAFRKRSSNQGNLECRLCVLVWTENILVMEPQGPSLVIPLACPIFSQLMGFQISPACGRGNNKG